jgi:putative Holliday junction resolvase
MRLNGRAHGLPWPYNNITIRITMKLLGIDYGRRRIGIAAASEGGIASGLRVIDRKVTPDCINELQKIIADENPSAIIFGLPLGADDEETEMSQEVRAFAASVAEKAKIPIHFVDESFTSVKAAELKMHRKKKTRRDKSTSDRIAACLILQNFIDYSSISIP